MIEWELEPKQSGSKAHTLYTMLFFFLGDTKLSKPHLPLVFFFIHEIQMCSISNLKYSALMTIPVSALSFYKETAKYSGYLVDPAVRYPRSNSGVPLISYITMGKLLNLSMYLFP